MSKSSVGALSLAHDFIRGHVGQGDFCIDATAGRGGDTLLLCRLVGERGRVLSMDIQQDATDSTRALLAESGLDRVGEVVLDSHANMDRYAGPGSAACVVFNLGWLPGGDHSVFTRPESTIEAIGKALEIIRPGGIVSISIYYGRDCGFEERDRVLDYLQTVDFRRYTVFVGRFHNRPNNPPIPVFITRDE